MIHSIKSLEKIITIYKSCNNIKVLPIKTFIIFISVFLALTIINFTFIYHGMNLSQSIVNILMIITILISRKYSQKSINYKVNKKYKKIYGEPTEKRYSHFELFHSYIITGLTINEKETIKISEEEIIAASKLLHLQLDEKKDFSFIDQSKIIVIAIISLPIIYNYYIDLFKDPTIVAYAILAIIFLPGIIYIVNLLILSKDLDKRNILRYMDRTLIEFQLKREIKKGINE